MLLRQYVKAALPPAAVAAGIALLKLVRKRQTSVDRVRVPYGEYFIECDASHHLPGILAHAPDFGRPLADVVLALEAAEPRVIDVGANIGDTALLLARFAPGTQVLCIEGDPRFMPDLRLNTSQVGGVTIAEAILGERSGTIRGRFLSREHHGGTASLTVTDAHTVLQVHTLDDLLSRHPGFSRPDVLKIDTDGSDPAILRGATRVLQEARPVAFYEWDPCSYEAAGEDNVAHADRLMALGYDQFLIFTNAGQPLLRTRKPGREVWESLAHFSRIRREIDGWHYDIAAFHQERRDALDRLWRRYVDHQSSAPVEGRSDRGHRHA